MTVTTFPAPSRAADSAGIVARNLKRLMAERGVPQRQVAEVLGVTQSNVSKRLKGRTPFTTDDLDALARAFEVHPGDLLSDAGQNTNTPAARRDEGGDELPRLDSNQEPAGYSSPQVSAEILPFIRPIPHLGHPICTHPGRSNPAWAQSRDVADLHTFSSISGNADSEAA